MENFKIGNWTIKEDGIHWNDVDNEYFIPKQNLSESGTGDRQNAYDWLVHLSTKAWVSTEDIYTLNSAFIYAMELYNLNFFQNSFMETFKLQQKEIELNRNFI